MEAKRRFRIVTAGVALRFDAEHPKLTSKRGAIQISSSGNVRVVPARTGGSHNKTISLRASRGNKRRAFFRRSINLGSEKETVPVDEFRILRVVDDVDRDTLAFAKT